MLKLSAAVLAIAAQAYAAVTPGATYKDPTTGLTWTYLSSTSDTVGNKVQASYAAGWRPATADEFTSVSKATAAFNQQTGFVYGGNNEWVPSPVSGAPGASVRSDDTTADTTGVWGVKFDDVDCPADVGILVNAVDLYSFPITDNVNDGCMCNSQRSGGLCDQLTTATACNSTVASDVANTGQQILGGGVVDGSTDSVVFNISSPQVATRNVTSFNWGDCDNTGAAQGGLSSYKTATQQSSCQDVYDYGFRVSELVSSCGLARAVDDSTGDFLPQYKTGFVRYRGDFMIYYKEQVNVSGVYLTRTGRLVTPIDLYINRTQSAELDAQTSIVVSSPFQLQAAITSTTVKLSATTSEMVVALGLKAPYDVIAIDSAGDGFDAGDSWTLPHEANNNRTDIADACILGNVTSTRSCVANPTQATDSGLRSCAVADYDPATGICWRNVTILITNGAACSLDETIRIPVISIYCSVAYPSSDCPLGPTSASADNSTGVSVTIRADDFCDGDRALVINEAVVIQSYVPQRSLTRDNDENVVRAYLYGETVYLLLSINQTASLRVFELTPSSFMTKLDGGSYYAPPQAAQRIADANAKIVDSNGNQLGWDTTTQTHVMQLQMNPDAVVDGANNPLIVGSPSAPVFAQLIFTVDYEAARRRRRQAGNSAPLSRGQAAMEANFNVAPSDADVAANSNEAPVLSSGRLVAVVSALLCGAALLL